MDKECLQNLDVLINSYNQWHYVGNLRDNTTEDGLHELFGLRSIKYLKRKFSVKMSINSVKNYQKQEIFWLNGWVFVYELSGCGFESCCSHLK